MTDPSQTVSPKIIAVVVTYNRADKLGNGLRSLQASTTPIEEILVVDNASTDNTVEVIAAFSAESPVDTTHIRLDTNRGGAGGFNEGIRRAYARGADHVWVLDDDAHVRPDSLAELLGGVEQFERATGSPPGFACSVVEWTDGSLCKQNAPVFTRDAPRYAAQNSPILLVKSCSFVSALLPRWGIEKVGLPIADFFIWYDDTEFTLRLADQTPGVYCLHSRVVHDTATNEDIDYGSVKAGNRWKYELGLRNQTAWTRRNRGWLQVVELVLRRRMEMSAGGVSAKHRLAIYRSWLRGLSFRYRIEQVSEVHSQ